MWKGRCLITWKDCAAQAVCPQGMVCRTWYVRTAAVEVQERCSHQNNGCSCVVLPATMEPQGASKVEIGADNPERYTTREAAHQKEFQNQILNIDICFIAKFRKSLVAAPVLYLCSRNTCNGTLNLRQGQPP